MNIFQGEDLIVINIEEVKQYGRVEIENTRINRFRNQLRQKGYSYDLGMREFETLRYRYPSNICIEPKSVTIQKTDHFVNIFERRKSEYSAQIKSLSLIWNQTK